MVEHSFSKLYSIMETSKSDLSKTNLHHSNISQLEVSEQIYFLRKLQQYQEENEFLLTKIRQMEEELSKKNANKPVEADLTQVLTQLLKKNSKLQSELSKTVHRQNEALAEIRVRKQSIKLARNERVIHSGIFKNIEKEIKIKEDVYKNLLIEKKLQELSKARLQEEYNRKIKGLQTKIKELQKVIEETKVKKEQVRQTIEKQKESYILRKSIIPNRINTVTTYKQSSHSNHHRNPTMDKVVYDYTLCQLQQQKLLKLTEKQTLEEVAELMQTIDNQEMIDKIEKLTAKIDQAQTQLKSIVVEDRTIYQKHIENEVDTSDYESKKHLISKINKEKSLIEQMAKQAFTLAEVYKIPCQNLTDLEVFQAIEQLLPSQASQEVSSTPRTSESNKLTQLLLKSKRSKENEQLMSSTKFKELFSNLHASTE